MFGCRLGHADFAFLLRLLLLVSGSRRCLLVCSSLAGAGSSLACCAGCEVQDSSNRDEIEARAVGLRVGSCMGGGSSRAAINQCIHLLVCSVCCVLPWSLVCAACLLFLGCWAPASHTSPTSHTSALKRTHCLLQKVTACWLEK